MAIKDIERIDTFYDVVTAQKLARGYTHNGRHAQDIFAKILDTVLDTRDEGVLNSKEIVEQLNDYALAGTDDDVQILEKLIQIFHNGAEIVGAKYDNNISEIVGADKQESPILAVVNSNTPRISQAVRGTNDIVKFLMTIPTIEMSRAVPYLDVRFELPESVTSKESGKLQTFSAMKFLLGAEKVTGVNKKIAEAANFDYPELGGKGNKTGSRVGMEVFTSPQTLQNLDYEHSKDLRNASVIDPFRPLMSLDSFEVDAAPAIGLISFKSAKLNLTVHDRSRLGEVHQFVKPETYTRTKIVITYGWNHPDDRTQNNAYADIINKMRITEKFGIANASFSFDNVGQIKVQLQLYSAGANDVKSIRIAESSEFENFEQKLSAIASEITSKRDKLGMRQIPGQAEVRVYQILDGAERGTLADLSKEDKTDLKKLVSKLRSGKSTGKELADKIDSLFGVTKDDGGIKKEIEKTINGKIQDKVNRLKNTADPFLDQENVVNNSMVFAKIKEFNKQEKKIGRNVTSFAKLLLVFVGTALQSKEDLFDEVQFIFYPINEAAGYAAGMNIGSFPIEISQFQKLFNDYSVAKGSPNLPLSEFIKFVYDACIDDIHAIPYGFRHLYSEKSSLEKPPEVKKGTTQQQISDAQAEATAKAGGIFKKPVFEIVLEALPSRNTIKNTDVTTIEKNNGLGFTPNSILRIHVYDKISTPYSGYQELLQANRGLTDIIAANNTESDKHLKAISVNGALDAYKIGEKLKSTGLKYTPGTMSTSATVEGSFNDIKNFVKATVPSLVYGTNNTSIFNASVQTLQDQLLSAANMQKAGKPPPTEPNGAGAGGLPLRVFPGQVDMNILGCPLLAINNQFFIDFGTGTTLDNLYLLNRLSHTISQGKFETRCTFSFLEGYGTYESISVKFKQIKNLLEKTDK